MKAVTFEFTDIIFSTMVVNSYGKLSSITSIASCLLAMGRTMEPSLVLYQIQFHLHIHAVEHLHINAVEHLHINLIDGR